MLLTEDGRFHFTGSYKLDMDGVTLGNWILGKQKVDPYDVFIVDTWGLVGMGVYDTLKEAGIPVLSMPNAFLAISSKMSKDVINATPNRYTPKRTEDQPITTDGAVPMSLGNEPVEVEVL